MLISIIFSSGIASVFVLGLVLSAHRLGFMYLRKAMMKSLDEEFLLGLALALLADAPPTDRGATMRQRDAETIRSRVAAEGVQFLTKTLPRLGKAFDRALETGVLELPERTRRSTFSRNMPAFLQDIFNLCFDVDGRLLQDPPIEAVRWIRQFLFAAYKYEIPYTPSQERAVIESFLSNEEVLSSQTCRDDALEAAASYIARNVLEGIALNDLKPRHGPGAVSTREVGDEKWTFTRVYSSLQSIFPFTKYFMVWGSTVTDLEGEWLSRLSFHSEGYARVVLVPKDSRGPRLISCEPLEYQWIQQGIGRKLMSYLETHKFTGGHINFSDQSINRSLALSSSVTKAFSTLDLKDASDLVSLRLVRSIFRHNPEFLEMIEACRTPATTLPDGSLCRMEKFAPMGSALCFPIESFVFFCVAVAAIARTGRTVDDARNCTFVYGDDIIVATQHTDAVIRALESVGLRVNRDKSFVSGEFRESCGLDAFKGVEVQPLRARKRWTGRRSDGQAYAAYVSLANSFDKRYYNAAMYLWSRLKETYGKIPYGLPDSPFPCKQVSSPIAAETLNKRLGIKWRVNRQYHRTEFQVPLLTPKSERTRLDGYERLLRDMVVPMEDADPDRVVSRRSTRMKRRWASV